MSRAWRNLCWIVLVVGGIFSMTFAVYDIVRPINDSFAGRQSFNWGWFFFLLTIVSAAVLLGVILGWAGWSWYQRLKTRRAQQEHFSLTQQRARQLKNYTADLHAQLRAAIDLLSLRFATTRAIVERSLEQKMVEQKLQIVRQFGDFAKDWKAAEADQTADPDESTTQADINRNIDSWRSMALQAEAIKRDLEQFLEGCAEAEEAANKTRSELKRQLQLIKELADAQAAFVKEGYLAVDASFTATAINQLAEVSRLIARRCYQEGQRMLDDIDLRRSVIIKAIRAIPEQHQALVRRLELAIDKAALFPARLRKAHLALEQAKKTYAPVNWSEEAGWLARIDREAADWPLKEEAATEAVSMKVQRWLVATALIERLEKMASDILATSLHLVVSLEELDDLAVSAEVMLGATRHQVEEAQALVAGFKGNQALNKQKLAELLAQLAKAKQQLHDAQPNYRAVKAMLEEVKADLQSLLADSKKRHEAEVARLQAQAARASQPVYPSSINIFDSGSDTGPSCGDGGATCN